MNAKLAIVLTYAVIVTYLSLRAPNDTPTGIPHFDKIGHTTIYFFFTYIVSTISKSNKHLTYFSIVIIVYSALIELLQPYVGRTGSVYDLAANILGVTIGFITATILFRPKTR